MATGRKKNRGVSAEQPYGAAAHRILQAAFKDVRHWLQLAARRRCRDDGENVHHLRVSTRRACVALEAFSDLIHKKQAVALCVNLRRIRKAADGARNIDVIAERFLMHTDEAESTLKTWLKARLVDARERAQKPIDAIFLDMSEGSFVEQVEAILHDARTLHRHRSNRPFRMRARGILKPVLKKFFKAADLDTSDNDALHRLRIQAKKMRYTMDIVGAAFAPSFTGKLYRQLTAFQDTLGTMRDHIIAEEMLRRWLAAPCDKAESAFLHSLLAREKTTLEKLKKSFARLWTAKCVSQLHEQCYKHLDGC